MKRLFQLSDGQTQICIMFQYRGREKKKKRKKEKKKKVRQLSTIKTQHDDDASNSNCLTRSDWSYKKTIATVR